MTHESILSVRAKSFHKRISLKKSPLKSVLIFKRATKKSTNAKCRNGCKSSGTKRGIHKRGIHEKAKVPQFCGTSGSSF